MKVCEDPGQDTSLFSLVPSSRTSPGTEEGAGNVREQPYRTDTDTPTYTGDPRRTQQGVRGAQPGALCGHRPGISNQIHLMQTSRSSG